MNKNIRVITKDLWMVDFNYIKAGFIKEITFVDENYAHNFCLSKDGKLILDSSAPNMKRIADFFIIIMSCPSSKLCTEKGLLFFIYSSYSQYKRKSLKEIKQMMGQEKFDMISKTYFDMAKFEMDRRQLKRKGVK